MEFEEAVDVAEFGEHGPGDFGKGDGLAPPGGQLRVFQRGFFAAEKAEGGKGLHLAFQVLGGAVDDIADDHGGAGGDGGPGVGDEAGSGQGVAEAGGGEREGVGGDLGEDGMDALAHFGGGDADVDAGFAVVEEGEFHAALGHELGLAVAGEGGAVGEEGQADAVEFLLALAEPAAGRLLELAGEIRTFDRQFKAGGGAVFGGEHLAGGGDIAGAGMDAAAVGVGGLADAGGDGVEVGFDAPDGLGGAEAAEGAAGDGIRAGDPAADDDVVAAVGEGAVEDAAEHDDIGDRQVGAAVEDEVAFDGGEGAVLFEAGFVSDPDGMGLGVKRMSSWRS